MAIRDIFKDQLKGLQISQTDKSNVRWLCYCSALSDLCAALSCPVTDKWTMSCPEVTPQLISFSNVFWGLAVILICKLWYKGSPVRDFIWKSREWLNIGYWASTTGCVIWMFIAPNPYLLYIIDAMIFWFIFSSWFGRIIDFTKAKLFSMTELRNSYDTMKEMYCTMASTAGYFIGSLITDGMPLRVAFIFWEIGVTVRVVGQAIVFIRNRATLTSDETEVPIDCEDDELTRLRAENEMLKAELARVKE